MYLDYSFYKQFYHGSEMLYVWFLLWLSGSKCIILRKTNG